MAQFRLPAGMPAREADPAVETSVVSILLYRRVNGTLVPAQVIEPSLYQGTHGLAVRFVGPCSYYLDQIRKWEPGRTVCAYNDGHNSRYLRVDEVHRAVSAALAFRLAVSPAA